MRRLICFIIGHKWGRWELYTMSFRANYPYPVEEKDCQRCSKYKFRPYPQPTSKKIKLKLKYGGWLKPNIKTKYTP